MARKEQIVTCAKCGRHYCSKCFPRGCPYCRSSHVETPPPKWKK